MIVGLGDEESVCLARCTQSRQEEGDKSPFKFFETQAVGPDRAVFVSSHDVQDIQLSCSRYILVKTAYRNPCAPLPIWAESLAHSLELHCD